ncbi:MAG: element excision factor XisH family protein [Caldilineaceae bacterium]
MPARDILHDIVKAALTKEGWLITHDPFTISFGIRTVYVDLGVERLLAAQRGDDKLVIEVKSFVGMSKIADLEQALGQYMIYRSWLKRTHPDRILYVAINDVAHKAIFLDISGQVLLEDYAIRMIVVDAQKQEIVQWID